VDEFFCIWYELTDKIRYFPGISSNISYKACFHNLPAGLQTHVYAPTGLDIQGKWSVGGNMPGEQRQPIELGLANAPREGLYLREDVNMRCNLFTSEFVKKTLTRAHELLVQRLVVKADLLRRQTNVLSVVSLPSFYGESIFDPYNCPDEPSEPDNLFESNRVRENTLALLTTGSPTRMEHDLVPQPLRIVKRSHSQKFDEEDITICYKPSL
jgi:hypothetical protein